MVGRTMVSAAFCARRNGPILQLKQTSGSIIFLMMTRKRGRILAFRGFPRSTPSSQQYREARTVADRNGRGRLRAREDGDRPGAGKSACFFLWNDHDGDRWGGSNHASHPRIPEPS